MIPSQRAARVVLGLLFTSLGVAALAPVTRAVDDDAAPAPANDAVEQAYDIHDMLWAAGDGKADDGRDDTRHALAEEIVDLVRNTVDPDAWEKGAATIREHDGRLLVKASPAIHVGLASLFEQFRDGPTGVQGVSLDCQFIIADEGFVRRELPDVFRLPSDEGGGAPAAATRPSDSSLAAPSVRAIGPFKARQVADAARVATRRSGAVIIVPAVMPLYYMNSSFTHGREHALKLPLLAGDGRKADAARQGIEVRRPMGMSMSVRGAYDTRYVTLDLSARHAELDAKADGTYEESEAAYRGTFTVERSGAFVACAPIIRARLAGARESDGPAGTRRDVVREPVPAAQQPDPRRFMLLVGTARVMTPAEITLIAGERTAQLLGEREKNDLQPAAGPPGAFPPKPPGVRPAPPPQPPDNGESTRVYNIAGLLLGSEPDGERQAAREKRLKRVLDAITKATGQETHVRELAGQIIVTGRRSEHAKIYSLLNEMIDAQALRPH